MAESEAMQMLRGLAYGLPDKQGKRPSDSVRVQALKAIIQLEREEAERTGANKLPFEGIEIVFTNEKAAAAPSVSVG